MTYGIHPLGTPPASTELVWERTPVTADLTCTYTIRTAVSADLACNYAIRESVTADLTCAYSIREWVTADLTCTYGIGQAAEVWAYALPNGVRAGDALAAVYDILTDASGAPAHEGSLTLGQILRVLLAHAAGNATGLDGPNYEFVAQDGTTVRVAGTISSGARTITTIDGG